MSDLQGKSQKAICLGTHGEDYGSWMSTPVFYMVGGLTAAGHSVCDHRGRAFGAPWLDHMDSAAVFL